MRIGIIIPEIWCQMEKLVLQFGEMVDESTGWGSRSNVMPYCVAERQKEIQYKELLEDFKENLLLLHNFVENKKKQE